MIIHGLLVFLSEWIAGLSNGIISEEQYVNLDNSIFLGVCSFLLVSSEYSHETRAK